MSNKFILELDLGNDLIEVPHYYNGGNLKVNIFGKDLTLEILTMSKDIKEKELAEARKEVNDTKEAHKRAQQKLSKLLEG